MILVELYRQVRRLRTWIAFAGLAALPTIAALANRSHGRGGDRPGAEALFALANASGLNHAMVSLLFMSQFFLIVVAVSFAGESVAGEASWGTLRSLLTRPVGRVRLLVAKVGVAAALALAATLVVSLAGLISGTLLFGWHPVARGLASPLSQGQALLRLGLANLYVAWSLFGFLSFAFMISTMTDRAGGAIGACVGLAVTSQILDSLPSLSWLHPWLPTHYLDAWSRFFLPGFASHDVLRGVVLQLAYAGVFLGIAFWHFRRKDILS